MPLPAAPNKISFSQINAELYRSSGAAFALNDSEGRKLASAGNTGQSTTPRTQVKLSNFRGHARYSDTVNATVYNLNLLSAAQSASRYAAGKTYLTYSVGSSGVVASTSTGYYAMEIDGFTSGDLIEVSNAGLITGAGGMGGQGGGKRYTVPPYSPSGQPGGNAVHATIALTFLNTGSIWGGGGGGGGGSWDSGGIFSDSKAGGGGGGGAGTVAGAGGPRGDASSGGGPGSPGTYNQGGAGGGGYGNGGPGGNPGQNGTPAGSGGGGAAGYYLVGQTYVNGGAGITSGDTRGQVS